MAIIITDGLIDDIDDVEKLTDQLADEVHSGSRKEFKLVLLGLGEAVDVGQLERLDDFDSTSGVDIWSSNLASDMDQLEDIFLESMSPDYEVARSGKIYDNNGQLLVSYNDGVPAKMVFKLKSNSTGFKLEIPNQKPIEQDLSEALNLLK